VPEFADFYRTAQAATNQTFSPVDEVEDDHWVFMSCLPWIQFTHVVQPTHRVTGSIPRLIWGRYYQQDGRWKLPLTVQVHHGLVDGWHMAQFLQRFEALLDAPW
jgi:chloramphenicol O-acetyltransferase type A